MFGSTILSALKPLHRITRILAEAMYSEVQEPVGWISVMCSLLEANLLAHNTSRWAASGLISIRAAPRVNICEGRAGSVKDKQMCGGVLSITHGDHIQLRALFFTLNVFRMESCFGFSSKGLLWFYFWDDPRLRVICFRFAHRHVLSWLSFKVVAHGSGEWDVSRVDSIVPLIVFLDLRVLGWPGGRSVRGILQSIWSRIRFVIVNRYAW